MTFEGSGSEGLKKIPALSAADAGVLGDSTPNDSATIEAKILGSGRSAAELERLAANGEHQRNERFKDNFEHIAICGLWLAAIVLLALAFTWIWHLLMPDSWHWLQPESVAKLQNIVTGGVLAGVATGHLKRRIG